MATLRDYFEQESERYLEKLGALLERGASEADAKELHRVARGLRGAAQMAREEDVYTAALALENAARRAADGALAWSEEAVERARTTLEDLRDLAAGGLEDDAARARAEASAARWTDAGVQVEAPAGLGERAAADEDPAAAFRAFAANEVSGIAEALDTGVEKLKADPENKEPLTQILRRQRALLGAARLEEIPAVAETLRAVEDLTRVIAKLGVAVKHEWFDVFRAAREVLIEARDALQRGENPQGNNALARLRHMRSELLDRYGEGEAVNTAAPDATGLAQAQAVEEPPPPPVFPDVADGADAEADDMDTAGAAEDADDEPDERSLAADATGTPRHEDGEDTVPTTDHAERDHEPPPPHGDTLAAAATPAGGTGAQAADGAIRDITDFVYSGEAALRAALEHRARLEEAAGDDPDAREAVEEVFDLIRLGLE